MEKITINQIKDQIKNNNKINIIISEYLSFPNKVAFLQEILGSCIIESDGIKTIDYIGKIYAMDIYMLKYYTNVNLAGLTVEDYDFLKSKKIIESVYSKLTHLNINNGSDFSELVKCIDNELEQIVKVGNSLESVISKVLKGLLDKLPEQKQLTKILSDMSKSLNNFAPEKYKQLNKMIDYVDSK